jgi:uncharacterized membrane protein
MSEIRADPLVLLADWVEADRKYQHFKGMTWKTGHDYDLQEKAEVEFTRARESLRALSVSSLRAQAAENAELRQEVERLTDRLAECVQFDSGRAYRHTPEELFDIRRNNAEHHAKRALERKP